MPLAVAELIVAGVELYTLVGAIFTVVFLWRGVGTVDHRVSGAPIAVRVLIAPGIVAFWPLFAWRWASGAAEPSEYTRQRAKAERP